MPPNRMVLFFDVDNTLLDNDAVYTGLHERIEAAVGPQHADRFWQIYDNVRKVNDVVNFPAAIEQFVREFPDLPNVQHLHALVFGFPFADVVYRETPGAIAHAQTLGLPVILSDGDPVFQPHKIDASGMRQLFDGRVIILEHKDQEFDQAEERFPGTHYVMVDDKPRIHRALKPRYGDAITTIMVCQGHYAANDHDYHGADVVLENIGEITQLGPDDIRARARH